MLREFPKPSKGNVKRKGRRKLFATFALAKGFITDRADKSHGQCNPQDKQTDQNNIL